MRARLGLRPLAAIEVGLRAVGVPDGTFFFIPGSWLSSLESAEVSANANWIEAVEIHKTTSGDLSFLGYVSPTVATKLADPLARLQVTVFVRPWAEHAQLVSVPRGRVAALEYRSFQDGYLADVTVTASVEAVIPLLSPASVEVLKSGRLPDPIRRPPEWAQCLDLGLIEYSDRVVHLTGLGQRARTALGQPGGDVSYSKPPYLDPEASTDEPT
jgi:hypothetical protein